jgi:DNA (cytosine-5)-methyltransferase 1
MNDPITFGSLFSGAGGFDLGLERAGMQCQFQVEWDKHCQQVLQYHWRDVPKWEDVQTVNGADLPPVEVIAWGSPCQDLSNAGKRIGLDGEKSSMFFEGIRIINEMREATDGKYPVVSIWENVAGAISSNSGRDFARVIREMADTGAGHIEWRVLDSQWFRVPQRRRRIFVLALWNPATTRASDQQVLAVSNSSQSNLAQGRTSADTAANSVGGSTATDNQPMIVDGTRLNHVRVFDDGLSRTLTAHMGTGGNNVPVICFESGAMSRVGGHIDKEISPTLRAKMGDNHPMIHQGSIIRKLTEIECERLMGWGDDHTRFRADGKETPMSQRYKMCGNGVVAPVAQWIGERITPLLRPTESEVA